jgi:hypothetical protein
MKRLYLTLLPVLGFGLATVVLPAPTGTMARSGFVGQVSALASIDALVLAAIEVLGEGNAGLLRGIDDSPKNKVSRTHKS